MDGMHLYNLTLQPSGSVHATAVGQFSGTRQQEIVVAKGSRLELLRPDTQTGKVEIIVSSDAFGVIRSLAAFRLTGGSKDYLIVGSDSGRIVILEYQSTSNSFDKVHQETFGRSGSRRIVPGQYLATDPKGRATMIGAMEKAKLVYILNRDAEANLTISSPLEAHRPNGIIHHIVGVDVGFENPLFACLEVDYSESDRDASGRAFEEAEKTLTYYELDLGLNHVVRRWAEPVDPRSNLLIQVPGGYNQNQEKWDGPSGVLVCSEDYITYKHQDQPEHRVPIPKRLNPIERPNERRGTLIVASVLHKMKNAFFFLVQTEDGDLFKITMDHQDDEIRALRIKYFDTVPVASGLCILRSGFLFVASEFGPQLLYSFQKLGDDDELPEYISTDYDDYGAGRRRPQLPTFTPRPLDNLVQVDEVPSLDPILDALPLNPLASDSPQIFAACGRGARSSFKMLRHGLEALEAVSSDLPGVPSAVWTTKITRRDEYDSYIILSFVNGTLVLSIGETIEEVSDSGLLTSSATLAVQQLGEDALLQVHPHGIRHILVDKQINEWVTPSLPNGRQTTIVATCTNERQVVVALSSNELVYFELDMDGQLNEYQERKAMGAPVLTMSMPECPEGRQRTAYLAVGCGDSTVRIISLEPSSTLASISIQALTAPASSICMAEMHDSTVDRHHATTFVNIGLQNGVLLRTVLDGVTGQLTDTRTRFLGSKAVRLVRTRVHGQTAVMALSTRTWLSFTYQSRVQFTPLIFDALDHAWSFSAELCPDGLIGIVGSTLRIFTIASLASKLKQDSVALSYTPRRMASHPDGQGLFYVVEADHRTLSPGAQRRRVEALEKELKPHQRGVLDLDPAEFGSIRAEAGNWASCVRVVDGVNAQTTYRIELDDNEAAFSIAAVPFASADKELFVVVGSAVEVVMSPRSFKKAYLTTYRLGNGGRELEVVHKTEVDDVPLVLRAFQGRLLAGVGKALRIYELGKKKLLRKCENHSFPTAIVALDAQGSRIVVGDMQESVIFASYKPLENRLVTFADDIMPRYVTRCTMLDYDTVAAADKFGNVYVVRIDTDTSRSVDEDVTGMTTMHEKPLLMGAAHKATLLAHYFVGDIITSLSRAVMVPGGREVLLYTGISGTIGALVPFVSKEDVDTMTTLEMQLRQQSDSLVGRDHLAYRSSYAPVKHVIDGDLCESFGLLPPAKQSAVAQELDRKPSEVNKKLAQLREGATGF
ncbi:pre-mRNA-splicing factor rse1 [Moesziomyces antarcticus]|uniref:Pre-mRNA-splicing factor RSE1 n=1 Tax=Pseudozyma antarctica TaxID=84753 RepID=A0A5C3FFY6_PSEA2|nr:pre-mRNA-splicing factor rse1 [Moesziomyces antarcticus]GAK61911.1 pre-mRNA-splicing factor rse1 [Moesziomyces antarcticus]SPO42431.1 probable splicing factor 3B subunit 3 [Moesziomyces antarcticus]